MKSKSNKFFLLWMIVLCVILFPACGKKSEAELAIEKEAEALSEMWGIPMDQAREMAKELLAAEAEYEVEYNANLEEKKAAKEEVIDALELVPMDKRIEQSKMGDPIIQVYGAVLELNGKMTLGEVFSEVEKNISIPVTLVDNNSNSVDDGGILDGATSLKNYKILDQNNDVVCQLTVINPNDDYISVKEGKVIDITTYGMNIHALNCFYSGGVIPSVYKEIDLDNEKLKEAFETRLEEMGGTVRYDEIENFLEKHGCSFIKPSSDGYYSTVFYGDNPIQIGGNKGYIKRDIETKFNKSSGNMTDIDYKYETAVEQTLGSGVTLFMSGETNVYYLDEIPDDVWKKVEEKAKESFTEGLWSVAGDGKLIAAANFIKGNYSEEIDLIFLTDNNTYVDVYWSGPHYIITGEIYIPDSFTFYGKEYQTLDELKDSESMNTDRCKDFIMF